jgi:hypothetical protein
MLNGTDFLVVVFLSHISDFFVNASSPQYRSVLRAIHTLKTPQNYTRLLRGLLPIHSSCWRGAQGLMWGARRPFLLAAAMVVAVVTPVVCCCSVARAQTTLVQ